MAGRTDLLCQFNGDGAAAAADVENALAGLCIDARDQFLGDGCEHNVLHGLTLGPVPAGHAVPECDLVGVAIMGLRETHSAQLPLEPVVLVFFAAGALLSCFGASPRTLPQGSTAFCAGILPSERL
jgi:hypothetical protein